MSISTVNKPEDTRDKIAKLREHHQPLLDALGKSDALFIPKLAYVPKGKDEAHVSFFLGELKKQQDVYMEFASKEYESEDPERTLWLWKYNQFWEEEYEKTEPMANGQVRYLVPVSELIKVNAPDKKEPAKQLSVEFFKDMMDPNIDAPIDQLTIRDLAAILLKKPVSQKKWLNEIVK
jgi:hypothetical protein